MLRSDFINGLLSRNFGQHHAISAGLDFCDSDWVVVMDSDLRDRSEVISKLFAQAQEGFDIVFVARQTFLSILCSIKSMRCRAGTA
jgi:dolichol-phosphate mannosyltransferase